MAPPIAPTVPVARPVVAPLPAPRGEVDTAAHRHVVKSGDDLWSLAESYYGEGREWRKIATANPKVLTGGPDRLVAGMTLIIPGVDQPSVPSGRPSATVRRGDTLSALAERELGSADRWPELFRANRSQLNDPDDLVPGMKLVLPDLADDHQETGGRPRPARDSRREVEPSPRPDRPTTSKDDASPPPPPLATPAATPSPSAIEPSGSTANPTGPVSTPDGDRSLVETVVPLTGVGALLAAGLLAGLAGRRRLQLQTRPVGRRILHPSPTSQPIEVEFGRRQRPLSLRTLDQALRAISAHCRTTGAAPPALELAIVGDDELELIMRTPVAGAPAGFVARGRSWILPADAAGRLGATPGFSEAARPWPALVTLGRDDHDRVVLADLESLGLLAVPTGSTAAEAILAAMAVELSFSPWADEMILTLVGSCRGLPEVLGKHNVTRTTDLDALLSRLEQRAAVQREHQPYPVLGQHRIDPDLADPWAPEIVLINQPMSDEQAGRLSAVVIGDPRVTIAAVVLGAAGGGWTLRPDGEDSSSAVLEPAGIVVSPQRLEAPAYDAVLELVAATGSDETTAAPWWPDSDVQPDPPPDNVTYLGTRFGGWGSAATSEQEVVMETSEAGTVHHPTLQILGPIELLGARGTLPPRAGKQCLEYCGWLLENPGTTAQAMSRALAVAEGTRRSNMSRLRSWLGAGSDGEAYLPDAYTGRIQLHPAVSSDWQRLQILTAAGVNRATDQSLRAALELVRGAPLADAAPGQWHWAEMLRTDMISCVRDIGAELADRALLAGDVDLARWAASRALVAAPGDELLLAARIRTEHQAGNVAETERLSLQLAAQARNLGVDLDPETVTLLQRVMEGRVRARLA